MDVDERDVKGTIGRGERGVKGRARFKEFSHLDTEDVAVGVALA